MSFMSRLRQSQRRCMRPIALRLQRTTTHQTTFRLLRRPLNAVSTKYSSKCTFTFSDASPVDSNGRFPPGASRPNLTWTAPLTANPSTEVEVKRAGGVPTALPAGVEVAPSGEFICRKDRNDGQHCGKIFSKKNDAVRHANTARVHVAQKSVTCPSW